ncbi:MAG TPA: TadE/TadG family type IV pilus assembly protein [Novosphingobium sp.]|nr:TadE/TadG family type IV pilus assembly protein [Novosphingobium sp.]
MTRPRFFSDQSGVAATEMALLVPLVIVLMFGGLEAGHFVWTQHKLAEAVRDGARFAGRLQIDDLCDGASADMSTDTEDEIKLLTRTGQLSSADAIPKVPGWTADQVTVELDCNPTVFVSTGIYSDLGSDGSGSVLNGPIVKVSASDVSYPSLLNGLGIELFADLGLSAESNAPVIGL